MGGVLFRILKRQTTKHQFLKSPHLLGGCDLTLTAVVLVAPIRTVTEAVAAEASDDAVDPISTGKESRRTL